MAIADHVISTIYIIKWLSSKIYARNCFHNTVVHTAALHLLTLFTNLPFGWAEDSDWIWQSWCTLSTLVFSLHGGVAWHGGKSSVSQSNADSVWRPVHVTNHRNYQSNGGELRSLETKFSPSWYFPLSLSSQTVKTITTFFFICWRIFFFNIYILKEFSDNTVHTPV